MNQPLSNSPEKYKRNLWEHLIFSKGSRKRSYLGEDALLSEVNPSLKRDYFRDFSSLRKVHFLFFGLLIVGSFLFFTGKAFNLGVLRSKEYALLSQRNKLRTHSVPAPRGVIYDRNGKVIAQNRPTFNLVLDISLCRLGDDLSLCRRIVHDLDRRISLDLPSILPKLADSSGGTSIVLAKDLTKEEILDVETLKMPAVDVLAYPSRDYLYPYEFAHLVGYTGLSDESLVPEIEGKTGVELKYNDSLKGLSGERVIQVNSQDESIQEFDTKDPVSGKNITIYADINLQKLAYEKLEKKINDPKSSAHAGVVVAQDPQTGGVLALVSYPSFDAQKMVSGITPDELKEMQEGASYPFFNRAIGATYAPGSTFKMVMASAILEEKVATPYTTIFDTGSISVAGYTFRNWDLGGHGEVDLLKALQKSNDTYFYTMGGGYGGIEGLGIDRISAWAEKFGFGKKTGIDLSGEVSGFVPDGDYKDWYLGDTYITSIGQGDMLATPLQTNMVTSYFANGSELLKPQVVRDIEGDLIDREVMARNLVSAQNVSYVREGLKLAVQPGGTGYPLFDFPQKCGVEVAGKTGTSEYVSPEGEERTHAWFTVWAPFDNAEIALTVFLEGGGSGSDDAAPIARDLLDYWFADKCGL